LPFLNLLKSITPFHFSVSNRTFDFGKTNMLMTGEVQIKMIARFLTLSTAILAIIFIVSINETNAQTRLGILEIPKGRSYQMLEDTLVVDELVLRDSATLFLHTKSAVSFIEAKRISIGPGGTINGKGATGAQGQNGKNALPVSGVCKDGLNGGNADPGMNGEGGKNLSINAGELMIAETFHIYLNGGNGGDGGKGGNGSGGSQSSAHCKSNGGDGGLGGNGGMGGNGGILDLNYASGISLADLLVKAVLNNLGGYHGVGGDGGRGGLRGHGASEQFSKNGEKGKNGKDGTVGKEGKALFYSVHRAGDK
jgi:hypothetical protein